MKVVSDKLILVIGGTGAQGQAVVKALLEPSSDGAPSPYTVRILHERGQVTRPRHAPQGISESLKKT